MERTRKPGHHLTAADKMRQLPATLSHRTSLQSAARVFARWQLDVLPVTDDEGRFVGAVTAADALRWSLDDGPAPCSRAPAWTDWQIMAPGAGGADEVRWHLATEPVVVSTDAGLADLARHLEERRADCALVLDERHRPVGVLSVGDCLAETVPSANDR